MRLSALLLLFGSALAFHFELDGHFAAISVEDIKAGPTSRGHFLPAEERLKEKLSAVLSGHLDEFYIHSFSIHGEDIHPSAIFTAYLSSSLSRSEIVKLVADDHDVDFFRLKELKSLPPAPEISSDTDRVSECFNGGFLLPNMSCACPPFILGDSCEEVSCLNGGIVNKGRCVCPPGRYALNCEQRGCLPSIQTDEGITKNPSFILVVSIKSTMAYVLNELANKLEITLDNFFASARYTEYIVVSYVHTKGALMMSSATFTTIPDMIQYLDTLIFTVQGREKQPTQRAVLEAQSFDPSMQARSTVFVFTDSLDEDAGPANYTLASNSIESQLVLQSLAWNNRIVYFFSETGTVDHSQAGDGYDTFERVAKATLGDIYTYPTMEVDTILNTIMFYGGQTLAARYGIGSTLSNTHIAIPESSGTAAVNILITVPSGKLPTLTTGTRIPLPLNVNGTRFAIYTNIANNEAVLVHPGAVKANIRVMTETGDSVFLTAAYDRNVDAGTTYLSANYDNMITFFATGIAAEEVQIEWITLDTAVIISPPSQGVSRKEECTYNLQFGPFPKCSQLGPIAQHVKMTDAEGQSTTILVPGYCLEMERRFPSQLVCHNGGTRQGVRTCRCTEDWMGQDCSTPKCYNAGQPNMFPGNGFGPCNCPTGYSGDHCEILSCSTPSTDPLPSSNTTIAIVMQNTLSQAQIGSSIDSGVAALLKQMQGKDTYNEYILTTFHYQKNGFETQNSMTVTKFGQPSLFESAVNDVSYRPTPINNQASLEALEATIMATTGGTTALFLFLDEGPIEMTQEADVIRMAVEKQIQVNIVITAPYEMMSMCMSKGNQNFYQQIAQKTGGIFLNLCQELRESYAENIIHSLFVSYADSHHRTETIYEQVFAAEPVIKHILFFVDQPNNDVFLIVNCPQTEGFTTTITNLEFMVQQTVKPVKVMPYLAVYKVPTAQVNTDGYEAQVTASGACNLKTVIKSNHAVYMRYSSNPSLDAQQSNITYGIPMYAVLHVQNPNLDRTLYPVLNAQNDKNTVSWTDIPYMRTNSCIFEYFTHNPYICDRPSDSFTLQLVGFTTDGLRYTRSLRSFCYLGAQECLNGGYRLSNGLCKCPPDYGGLYCQSPKCKNAAFLDTDTFTCHCLYKWTGPLCDIPVCNDWNFLESVDPRNNNPTQITFVLNSLSDSLLVNVQLSSQIEAIVAATESQEAPVMYTLIMFDQFSSQRIISTSNSAQFVQAFQSYIRNVQQIPSYSSRSIDALVDAWKMNIQSPGVVYLFTSTPALTPFAVNAFDDFLQQKIDTQVNVFYTPKYGGNYPKLPNDTNSNALFQAVKQSGGRIVALTQNSVSQIAPMIISSTQVVEFVSDDSLEDCVEACLFPFSLENQFKTVEITILGIDVSGRGNVVVVDGKNKKLPIDSTSIVFSDTQILVLRYKSSKTEGGTWNVLVKTALGGAEVQTRVISDIHVFPGFTVDMNDDFVHQVPFTGLGLNRSTFMTFRVVDSSDHLSNTALLESVVISLVNFYKPTFPQVQVQDLVIYQRDTATCAYQFVSREWTVNQHAQQKFTVFGTFGNTVDPPFQRTFFYQFSVFSQRQSTCLHGQHDTFGQCICSDRTKWAGDYCQIPICQHGGTTSYGICICPNGYYGDFCELNVTV